MKNDDLDDLEIQAKKCRLCKNKCLDGEIYMKIWDEIESEIYHEKMRKELFNGNDKDA